MTAPKGTQKKEVERIYKSLERAFTAEVPDYPAKAVFNVPAIPEPRRNPRAHVLWEALRTAFATQARYRRHDLLKASKKRGERLESLDDTLRTRALQNLRRARAQTQGAADLLQECANAVASEVHTRQDEALDEIARVTHVVEQIDVLLTRLSLFKGIPQLRAQREWDLFLSETATKMYDAGFSSREVCSILTGADPDKVDRATLERFRQRVRRQQDPGT